MVTEVAQVESEIAYRDVGVLHQVPRIESAAKCSVLRVLKLGDILIPLKVLIVERERTAVLGAVKLVKLHQTVNGLTVAVSGEDSRGTLRGGNRRCCFTLRTKLLDEGQLLRGNRVHWYHLSKLVSGCSALMYPVWHRPLTLANSLARKDKEAQSTMVFRLFAACLPRL
jgi:hypothetical protein